MKFLLYRLRNVGLALFVVDVFAVLETCLSEAMLQFFLGEGREGAFFFFAELWIDAHLLDHSKYTVTRSTQDRFSRVQTGKMADLKVRTNASSLLHWKV